MKYRLAVLSILFLLVLASCSLAEYITPPPGYQSPTPDPATASVTQTPPPTLTSQPATATSQISPSSTQYITQSAQGTTPAPALFGKVTGNLVNGSGGSLPEGQVVTLMEFDKDQSGSYQNTGKMTTQVEPGGSFKFEGVELPQGRVFLVTTDWEDVEYQSDPLAVADATTDYSTPLTIYEKTTDLNILSTSQVHLIFEQSTQNVLQVTELYIVTNPGKQAVVVASDGTTISFIHIPKDASSVQYQLAQGSSQLLNATGGFAMIPGAEKQYGFLATYTMPYNRSLKFDQTFSMPVTSLTVFLPVGMHISSEQLVSSGTQDIQGKSYQMYQANNLASGSSMALTLSGNPGTSSGTTSSRQTLVIIGIAVVGVLLIGLGIYFYLRDRARFKRETEEVDELTERDALGEDDASIMDAMIALDDQFKAGEIPKEAYESRRLDLKERLRNSIRSDEAADIQDSELRIVKSWS